MKAQGAIETHTATRTEINYWHACGSLVELQRILKFYGLDFYNNRAAYDKFKIGYDDKNHCATFAIDDTHYYKIPFNEGDAYPLDKKFAHRVLKQIQSINEMISRWGGY